VEWNIGESVGLVAVQAIQAAAPPRHVRNNKKLLADFQRRIQAQGIEIRWPKVTVR
jgi:hypothetical protein